MTIKDGRTTIGRRHLIGSMAAAGLAAPALLRPRRLLASGTVEIGAVLPLTGAWQVFGQQARLGIDFATTEINQAGGILGQTISIDYQDDASDPQNSAAAAESLVARSGVVAVTGPISSASRDALADAMTQSHTPLLYATDYEGGACNDVFFFFNSVPNQSAEPLMRYAVGEIADTVFMLGADYVWPRRMFETSAQTVEAAGGQVIDQRFVPVAGLSDYGAIIGAIRSSGAGLLVLALPGAQHLAFVNQAYEEGLLSQVTVCNLGGIATYFHPDDTDAAAAAYGCEPFIETDPSAPAQAFVSGIRQNAGADTVVTSYAMTHYNAMHALKSALERSGEISREAAVAGLAGLEYQTPTGPSQIDADTHHSTLSMFIAHTGSSTLEIVEPLGAIAPQPGCAV
ncbi:MAG: ABC transporter substrate-binding protein [Pseudomonadota bacterium]